MQVDERRESLLRLGIELFSSKSYDELSIEDIARAAGISRGLLYHYFPSKRDYYVEVVRTSAAELLERTAPMQEPDIEGLREGMDTYLDFVEERASAYAMLLRGGIGTDPEVLQIVEETRQAFIDRTLAAMGVKRAEPVLRLALRSWIGLVEGASLDWCDHRDVDRPTLRELLVGSLVHLVTTAGYDVP